jgi:diaminopimelate decarboxylase
VSRALDARLVEELVSAYGTPSYVYDADLIRARIRSLSAFDTVRYAQKASSNLHLLRLMREEGVAVDAVSLGEIERALRSGYTGGGETSDLIYTADVIDAAVLERVVERGIPVNAGSEDMLSQLGRRRRGHPVWLRINPGFGHGHSRKTNTGGESSKHGIWHENLAEALKRIDEYDLDLVGLHMHIGSGADIEHLKRVGEAMVSQVRNLGRDLRAISAGGGLPVPYRPGEEAVDVDAYFRVWDDARRRIEEILGHPVQLEIEPGRYLVAESGWLLAEVRATKMMGGHRFALVDAGFDNLVRPAMYGSHHEISVVRPGAGVLAGPTQPTLVGGPLCESGDVFTQDEGGVVAPRELPEMRVGDLVVFHDAGAYAASMASNYNTRTLAPEVLIEGGAHRLIRRRQPLDDLLHLEEP